MSVHGSVAVPSATQLPVVVPPVANATVPSVTSLAKANMTLYVYLGLMMQISLGTHV